MPDGIGEDFAQEHVAPFAGAWDAQGRLPDSIVQSLGNVGYLGALVPRQYGGSEMDLVSFGALSEALGAACTSVRSLVTAHGMVCHAVARWGTPEQRERWLPKLADGSSIGAFALTESGAGSDIQSLRTEAVHDSGTFYLTGEKRWITFGQRADLVLVFGRAEAGFGAFMIEDQPAGMVRVPADGLLGARASDLATLRLDGCAVPTENLVARLGFGLSAIAGTALNLGRYSVAWGCVGLARAAAEASISYAAERRQFGQLLKDHQLVAGMVADMITKIEAARLLCLRAGQLGDARDARSVIETCMAKYLASTVCREVCDNAVQIHGANGCGSDYPVQRYFRDAKIMEIIEGSSQMQQLMISQQAFSERKLSRGQHR